jgi:hypothetical protein
MINIGIGISWAKAIYSVANNVIANFKARVLSYPNSMFEAGPCLDATLEGLNAKGLLDNASLIITPNAYNTGILYDVIPNTTLGDMTVVRATTATRVNSLGLIEVVPRNLVTYSNDITNAIWSKASGNGGTAPIVTANYATSPSGLNDATRIQLARTTTTGSFSVIRQAVTILPNTNYRQSVWLKSLSGTPTIFIADNGNFGTQFLVTLTTDWVRYELPFSNSLNFCNFDFALSQGVAGSSLSADFLVYGAQLEQGSTATEYFPTTTRLNIPRIDYTNGSCPSLLVEPQRTNLMTYSNDFSNAAWSKNTGAILANNATSPEGITNASKLVGVALTTQQWIYRLNAPVVSGSQHTFSIFAKKGEYNFIQLRNLNNIDANTIFNLNTGTVYITSTGTAKIENYGNGWYRCSVTATATLTGNSNIYVNLSTNGTGQQSFLGNGTSGVFIYGAQHETGSYATSYIPTVASTVTRNADVISKTGISSLIGQTEGTIFVDVNFTHLNKGSNEYLIQLWQNGSNRIFIWRDSSNFINYYFIKTGETFNFQSNVSSNSRHKIAFSYKSGQNAFYIDGSQKQLNSNAFSPFNLLSNFDLAMNNSSGVVLDLADYQYNSVQLYQTRLTNDELAQLTTL